MKINNHNIDIKNRDKIFFPKSGITKGQLIDYYEKISDVMLRHMSDRLLTLQRFPDGLNEEGFYQKNRGDYFPDWISSKTVKKEDGTVEHIICNDVSTLVYLANQACITFHIWLSKTSKVNHPDKIVFDLDPPAGGDFELVKNGADTLREYLEAELSMQPFLMTTGSQSLHIVLSIKPENEFDTVRQLSRTIAEEMTKAHPGKFTTEVRKKNRDGKLFIDYLRNAYAQTSVAPYSIRAIEGAPVATPLEWDELKNNSINAQTYHMGNIFRRMGQMEDPWKSFGKEKYSLKNALAKFGLD